MKVFYVGGGREKGKGNALSRDALVAHEKRAYIPGWPTTKIATAPKTEEVIGGGEANDNKVTEAAFMNPSSRSNGPWRSPP
ncbi:MAG: hypothetical protein M2R45_03256 [Verrucomicrobia subdivision 3 bacterium]|nr:hypothetical protein [Limisphaerales bacterium]MCS1416117.1 hypothetical protein [Limisphaerales bacterium]